MAVPGLKVSRLPGGERSYHVMLANGGFPCKMLWQPNAGHPVLSRGVRVTNGCYLGRSPREEEVVSKARSWVSKSWVSSCEEDKETSP